LWHFGIVAALTRWAVLLLLLQVVGGRYNAYEV
jgi:hypothetical protein